MNRIIGLFLALVTAVGGLFSPERIFASCVEPGYFRRPVSLSAGESPARRSGAVPDGVVCRDLNVICSRGARAAGRQDSTDRVGSFSRLVAAVAPHDVQGGGRRRADGRRRVARIKTGSPAPVCDKEQIRRHRT